MHRLIRDGWGWLTQDGLGILAGARQFDKFKLYKITFHNTIQEQRLQGVKF